MTDIFKCLICKMKIVTSRFKIFAPNGILTLDPVGISIIFIIKHPDSR